MLKHKKRKWNEQIISKLERLESDDPKQYWNLINELQKTPKNNDITNIDKFEKFYTDLFAKYTHGEKSTHDMISKNVEEVLEANKFVLEDDFTCEELNESLLKLKRITNQRDVTEFLQK